MKKIFILEDQIKGLELIKRIINDVFGLGDAVVITHKGRIKDVTDSNLAECDLAFIDLSLPDGMSFDLISKCKENNPDTPIIVTTLYSDNDMVFNALRSGADGYLLKSDGDKKLTQCLRRILDGEPPISPQIARKLMTQFRADSLQANISESMQVEKSENDRLSTLTSRESQVLTFISQGMVTKEIARQLELSIHTVNDIIKSIYNKLGINTRTQAAAVALGSRN